MYLAGNVRHLQKFIWHCLTRYVSNLMSALLKVFFLPSLWKLLLILCQNFKRCGLWKMSSIFTYVAMRQKNYRTINCVHIHFSHWTQQVKTATSLLKEKPCDMYTGSWLVFAPYLQHHGVELLVLVQLPGTGQDGGGLSCSRGAVEQQMGEFVLVDKPLDWRGGKRLSREKLAIWELCSKHSGISVFFLSASRKMSVLGMRRIIIYSSRQLTYLLVLRISLCEIRSSSVCGLYFSTLINGAQTQTINKLLSKMNLSYWKRLPHLPSSTFAQNCALYL